MTSATRFSAMAGNAVNSINRKSHERKNPIRRIGRASGVEPD
jgi:hypothetical protein